MAIIAVEFSSSTGLLQRASGTVAWLSVPAPELPLRHFVGAVLPELRSDPWRFSAQRNHMKFAKNKNTPGK